MQYAAYCEHLVVNCCPPACSADALPLVVAEFPVGCDAGVVGGGATAVVAGESRLASALAAFADAAFGPAAELTFVAIATEILTLAERSADDFVLELDKEQIKANV